MKKAVIIIPTYNEKENIPRLIPQILQSVSTVENWTVDILVVDDSSPDGTKEIVRELAEKNKHIHLLVNAQKQGLGSAYLKGMREAIDTYGADVVFEMDADFQHDPAVLPLFFHSLDDGADMVIGSRYIPGGSIPSHWGLYRKMLSVVGNLVNSVVLFDFRVHDWTTGYRAITKKTFLAIEAQMQGEVFTGYTFQIGFLHKTLRAGYTVREVPLRFGERTRGSSKLGNDYIKNALWYIFSQRFAEIIESRIFKFIVVGGIGFVINAVALVLLSSKFSFEPGNASAIGAEIAIVSNFVLNNLWTFSERRAKGLFTVLVKFVQFNIASIGAVLIQKVVVSLGTGYFGGGTKFIWFILAVAIGMFLNFFMYSKVIWRKK